MGISAETLPLVEQDQHLKTPGNLYLVVAGIQDLGALDLVVLVVLGTMEVLGLKGLIAQGMGTSGLPTQTGAHFSNLQKV